MAQWWELTIPAASTLLGAWSGFWWQGRSAQRQLSWQAHREDQARWFGERRTAYADLGKTSHALMLAAYVYWSSEAELREVEAAQVRSEGDLSELEANRNKALAAFNAAGDAARNAMVSVQVVGSDDQAEIAKELDAEWKKLVREPPQPYDYFASIRDRFLAQARTELSET